MPLAAAAEGELLGMGFTKAQCDQAAAMLGDDVGSEDAIQFIFAALEDDSDAAPSSVSPSATVMPPQLKMMLVVRKDLGMTVGKTASQCSHAALGCERSARSQAPDYLSAWMGTGEAIVCVSADSQAVLASLQSAASLAGLVTHTVADAGRTEVAPGTVTVLAIGPGPVELLDEMTGKLRLL